MVVLEHAQKRHSPEQICKVGFLFFVCLFVSFCMGGWGGARVSSLDFVTPRPQTALHSESNGKRGCSGKGKA